MDNRSELALDNFKNFVGIKFQLYNSLFTSLPFHRIEKTGILLSLFLNNCEEGYDKKLSPFEIVEDFFNRFTSIKEDSEKTDLLFRFVQYVERQVVLFDALEDAAFKEINDIRGVGSMKQLETKVEQEGLHDALLKKLEEFSVTLVLTAHPTQFYPGTVLAIIDDLSKALNDNQASLVNMYLQQLGKTPLFKNTKPTPYDEAVSLIWYLENVFYQATGNIVSNLKEHYPQIDYSKNRVLKMGFWPGGDRDGNPNVNSEITLKVAGALRASIIRCYYRDVRELRRRLTFKGVEHLIIELEAKLYNENINAYKHPTLNIKDILDPLYQVRETLITQHNGLFLYLLDNLIDKVEVFRLHFATLDIRQESSVHGDVLQEINEKGKIFPANYAELSEDEKINLITNITSKINSADYEGLVKETLQSFEAVTTIKERNGPHGCERYIISQCGSALNVMEVYALFLLTGSEKQNLDVDIVPLFETIDDLRNAPGIMQSLYQNETYFNHLEHRNKNQTIMVGFSDGTKDGGYLMANWSIYKAKEELTRISKEFGIDVLFFDGRGGPPARGGGKTHKFYASIGSHISTKEIQLTIQGQTVSSSFGTIDAAQYNMEQLLNAGLNNELFSDQSKALNEVQEDAIIQLSETSYTEYKKLKEHPDFLEYLVKVSPLNYYSETNISSRPSKRKGAASITLQDLRAIPFVGAWTQLKQNVPGFYGLGTALETLEASGKLEEIIGLYKKSQYFKTLIDNCEMAMKKCFFPLTEFLSKDERFAPLWHMIFNEYKKTEVQLAKLTGKSELMTDYPVERLSIQMRERIVLPLTTIQQYALIRLRKEQEPEARKEVLQKLVVRTSFGIINAGRNSV